MSACPTCGHERPPATPPMTEGQAAQERYIHARREYAAALAEQAAIRNETMRLIAERTALQHGLTLDEIKSDTSSSAIAVPRQIAMVRMYATGRFSFPQIGNFFGRHHSTVIHARDAVARRAAA